MKIKSNAGKSIRVSDKKSEASTGAFSVKSDPVVASPATLDPHKYDTGAPESQVAPTSGIDNLGELPASYGQDSLYLVARDPHWFFSYWQVDWNAHGDYDPAHVALRILDVDGTELDRAGVNPHAPNWYIPVKQGFATVIAELGFTDKDQFEVIARSEPAQVPQISTAAAGPSESRFASVPLHVTFQQLLDKIQDAMLTGESLVDALARLQSETGSTTALTADWPDNQRKVLEALLGREVIERISMGSGSMDKVLRRQLEERLGSAGASELFARKPLLVEESLTSGVTSFGSGKLGASWSAQPFSQPRGRGFFMHVNAEVIFYGGTDPDAQVWIDNEKIDLEPDGTFRYHFTFPDGKYEVPIVALSPDGEETRSATLSFKRETNRQGEVGHTRQPARLTSPIGSSN